MREIAKKLKISYNVVYYSLHRIAQTGSNQNRKKSVRPRCTTEQEDKYIRVSSLRNKRLTGPQLAASLNSTRKTPVSTSTVKRRLRDADLHLHLHFSHLADALIQSDLQLENTFIFFIFFILAPRGKRTHNPGVANAMLYQLSYIPAGHSLPYPGRRWANCAPPHGSPGRGRLRQSLDSNQDL